MPNSAYPYSTTTRPLEFPLKTPHYSLLIGSKKVAGYELKPLCSVSIGSN